MLGKQLLPKHNNLYLMLYLNLIFIFLSIIVLNITIIHNQYRNISITINSEAATGGFQEAVVKRCFVKKVFLELANSLKKRLWHRYFPVNFCEFSMNTFFTEHLQEAVSFYSIFNITIHNQYRSKSMTINSEAATGGFL